MADILEFPKNGPFWVYQNADDLMPGIYTALEVSQSDASADTDVAILKFEKGKDPVLIEVTKGKELFVRVRLNGKIEYGPLYVDTDAAQHFWLSLANINAVRFALERWAATPQPEPDTAPEYQAPLDDPA